MPVGYCLPYCVERPTCPLVVGYFGEPATAPLSFTLQIAVEFSTSVNDGSLYEQDRSHRITEVLPRCKNFWGLGRAQRCLPPEA
jgi:hypothetical protein